MSRLGHVARRRLAAIAVVLSAVVAAVVSVGADGGGKQGYRIDAIFDNTAFLIPGQDVKIAGAEAGQVEEIHLTKDRRARVQMRVLDSFAPFREDAECMVRPQSLIGEKFVQCHPGTADAKPLRRRDGDGAPTVRDTHSPVDLDLVFGALRLPVRQRLSILLNELGTGLAGRPAELNAAIRRANPALDQTNRVLGILDRDRAALERLIDRSDRFVAELARRRGEVADFVDDAEEVARTAADRRGDLDLAVRRLPPLLAELEPASLELAGLSREARPVVRDLSRAAGPTQALLADLGPLSGAARPTLPRLSRAARTGIRAVRDLRPVARRLRPVARDLVPIVDMGLEIVVSLRANGAIEGLLTFLYHGTTTTARFDRISHVAPSYQIGGPCNEYAETRVPECDAHYAGAATPGRPRSAGASTRSGDQRTRARAGGGRSARGRRGGRTAPAPPRGAPGGGPRTGPPSPGGAPGGGGSGGPSSPDLGILDWLLGP
jgi:virulence factor Mce-like protein